MTQQIREEFREFISALCRGICTKLKPQYNPNTVDTVCSSFAADMHEDIIDCVLYDWQKCRCQDCIDKNPDDLISILILNLIGPLNRVRLPETEPRAEFNFSFLSLMDRLLHHEKVQPRFLQYSQELMQGCAA